MSDCERNDLDSGRTRRGGLASAAEVPGTTPPGIRYGTSIQQSPFLFVLTLDCLGKCTIYSTPNDSEMFIESSYWSWPAIPWSYSDGFYCAATQFIKRMHFESWEKPSTFCTPIFSLGQHIMRYSTDTDRRSHLNFFSLIAPGLSPDQPMAIVQADSDVQMESPLKVKVTSILDGRYLIKNRAADI